MKIHIKFLCVVELNECQNHRFLGILVSLASQIKFATLQYLKLSKVAGIPPFHLNFHNRSRLRRIRVRARMLMRM